MALNIINISGTTTIPGFADIVNNNFQEVDLNLSKFIDIYDGTNGNIDLTANPTGILKAKSIVVPLGTNGITVGNTTITDNAVSTKTLSANVLLDNVSSIQSKTFAINATSSNVIAISATTKTLILDPTTTGLIFEISSSVSNAMTDLYIVNLSTTNDTCTLNVTANFIDQSSIDTIAIPYKKNLHLRYINNIATNTTGWYVVSHNGCTIA